MKKFIMLAFLVGFLTFSVSSCRDQKTTEETLIEDMQDRGADVKIKDDGERRKVKMETDDKKVKIKTDEDGNKKIKVKDKG